MWMKAKYKIVDTFNGGEFGRFALMAKAESALAKQRKRFYAQPGNQNAIWKREIASISSVWMFNHTRNQWEWSELVNTGDTDIF